MNTLYINIKGDDIKSTENMTVVGKPEDAIINKFYFELVKGIVKGVSVPGIGEVKKKSLVTDFAANNAKAFAKITEQWDLVKQALLGENPDVTFKMTLPQEYVEWLYNHTNRVCNKIAESLASRGNAVEIIIGNIYVNGLLVLVNNIDTKKEYGQFVVSDALVDDESAIAVAIRERVGRNVPLVAFSDWEEKLIKDLGNNGNPKDQSEEVSKDSENIGKYDEIQSFHEGMAVVRKGDKYGFVNSEGEEVIPCKYKNANRFSEGVALVNDRSFINHKGNIELRVLDDNLLIVGDFHDGFCRVRNNTNGLYGYVDKSGYVNVKCKYLEARDYNCGIAMVWKKEHHKMFKDCKSVIYFLDKSGQEGCPRCCSNSYSYEITNAVDTSYGFFVEYGHAEQCIIKDVDTHKTSKYIQIEVGNCFGAAYEIGSASVHIDNNSLHNDVLFFNDSNKQKWIWYDLRELNKMTHKDISGKIRNKSFKELDSRKYTAWGSFSKEGLQPFKNNYSELWGYISTKNEVIVDFQYEDARIHSEGLAAVAKNGKWGYIDAKGKLVIPFDYSKANEFSEGRAVVEKEGVIMVIDKKGKRIV